jgi:thiol-disulfide isomerase/thioredoxin
MLKIVRISCRALVLAAAVGVAALVTPAGADAEKDAGTLLMSHTLRSLDGGEVRLETYEGEVIVVNFWASWCAPCRKELPIMNQWNDQWDGRGARVVAISIDNELRNAQRFAEQAKLTMPLFHDGPEGLAKELDLPSVPCTYLIDRSGRVVSIIQSSSSKELASLEERAESLMRSGRRAAQKAGMTDAAGLPGDGGNP